jgi:hypothetical protein
MIREGERRVPYKPFTKDKSPCACAGPCVLRDEEGVSVSLIPFYPHFSYPLSLILPSFILFYVKGL